MTIFIHKLLVAVVPFMLLVGGIAMLSSRRLARPRRLVLWRRASRPQLADGATSVRMPLRLVLDQQAERKGMAVVAKHQLQQGA